MSTFALATLAEADVLALGDRGDEPQWLRDRRLEAYKVFADLDWPTRRTEEWRYTDPGRYDLGRPALLDGGPGSGTGQGVVATVADRLAGLVRVVDGGVAEARVSDAAAAQGVVAVDLAVAVREHEAVAREALGAAVPPVDRFTAANLAAWTSGAFVHVPAGVELDDPVAVVVEAASPGTMVPRVVVSVGANAWAKVYVDHVGAAETTVVEVVEVVLAEGARVDFASVQDWGGGVDHVGAHRARVGANATFRGLEATLGGRTVYLTPDAWLAEPGGSAELLGVYVSSEGQHLEHRSLLHHDASHTTSDLLYKGALQGDSKATWYGNIRIEPHARATASDETNRSLILTDLARADSIPFLEIENSDVVRCGHHSSIGQIDELQLFYLESRGIPREEAARMLVFAFFAEVTGRVEMPGVTETVLAEVEREIRSIPSALMRNR